MDEIKGVIFDLDGVICNTACYHFLAWKRLADNLGFEFTEKDNERLKGVSREKSLEILLEIGNVSATEVQKKVWAEQKNTWYIEYISKMTREEILPGVREFLQKLHEEGIGIALGSASKNAGVILKCIQISNLFDYIVDGNMIKKAKPDPEVFLMAAKGLGLKSYECIVFEDAEAGVEAAHRAGMKCVGVGNSEYLKNAEYRVEDFRDKNLFGDRICR